MSKVASSKIQVSSKASFRKLVAWQKAIILVKAIYQISASFPKEEVYGLTSQLKRAAVSIPSNIAEGSSRQSHVEFIRFINIARGSLAEVETQLEIAKELEFINLEELSALSLKTEEIGRLLSGLRSSLENKN